jgi:SAM-dependent methyltransferase
MMDKTVCQACGNEEFHILADFMDLPLTSRFSTGANAMCYRHHFELGQCTRCSLIQQLHPVSNEVLLKAPSWSKNTEHEQHLPNLVDWLIDSEILVAGQKIMGMSYKDDEVLAVVQEKLPCSTVKLNPVKDLGLSSELSNGPEIIQSELNEASVQSVLSKYGKFDVIFMRHALEHATVVRSFLQATLLLLKEGGHLIVEVPNCHQQLEANDYCMLWGEHVTYFLPDSLEYTLTKILRSPVQCKVYNYITEGSLIGVVQNNGTDLIISPPQRKAISYGSDLVNYGKRIRKELRKHHEQGKKIFMLGASHTGFMFIEMFRLGGYLTAVLDDNPNKLGLYSPGSGLRISPTSILKDSEADVCLLAVNPAREGAVLDRFPEFQKRGGEFKSIYRTSPLAVLR